MIPSTVGFIEQDFEVEEQPSKTYKIDHKESTIRGYTDEIEAVKQAVFMILSTERYTYPVLSWDYGVELNDLFGEPISYVCPELERRITEALTWDTRITDVSDFEFEIGKKGAVHAAFTVHTIYGDIREEKEVNI